MSRPGTEFIGGVLLLAALGARTFPQSAGNEGKTVSSRPEPAVVTSVRVVQEHDAPAIEVVSTHPVVPTIQSLDSPPRLVIDLANARSGLERKRIPVLQQNILTIRTEQHQKEPPVMRIVLDFLVPYGYTWDAAGNRLMVRLKRPEETSAAAEKPIQPPKVLSVTPAVAAAVVPVTSGIGEVVLAGSRFAAGSTLTAGNETAVLQLARGGEVRVCPGTTLSITPSRSARDLMLGLSTGALETDYALEASADSVLTPDFRILFAGPGEFHYAISTDSRGDTCVRGLRGNNSSAIVSELIGDRVYQVRPTEQAVFHSGRIDKVDTNVPLECGCPPPASTKQADTSRAQVVPDSALPATVTLAPGNTAPESAVTQDAVASRGRGQELSRGTEVQSVPAADPNGVHVQVDAPLVFHAKNTSPLPSGVVEESEALPVMESSARMVRLDARVQPPPAASAEFKPEHHGLLRRLKGFFAGIFR